MAASAWSGELSRSDDGFSTRSQRLCHDRQVKDRETLISSPVRGTAAMQEANFVADSLLEEDGFELAVPPRRERLWAATPGKHCRFGPEPVGGSAFRAAVSDWQRPDEPCAGAEPIVRIRSPSSAEAVPTAQWNGWATKTVGPRRSYTSRPAPIALPRGQRSQSAHSIVEDPALPY